MTDHKVWPTTPPATPTTSNDGQGITVANAFYTTGTTWSLKGVRLYVPTGSALIGQTVTFGGWQPAVTNAGLGGAATQTVTSPTLVAGWNEATFPAPIAVTNISATSQKFMVSYTSAGNYVAGTLGSSFVQASDASSLWFSEDNSGGGFTTQYRGYYRYANGTGANAGAWWGLDVIVDDGVGSSTTGTLSASIPKVAASVAGASLTTGTMAATTPKVTASIPGSNVPVTGTLAASLPKVTASLPGVVVTPVTGTLAATLPKVTASMPGTVTVTGTLSAAVPKVIANLANVVGLTIAQENALTSGVVDRSFWYDYGTDAIPGFPRSTYYTPGQTAQFSVDYNSAFTFDVFRLGWYGGTSNARRVATAVSGTPTAQPSAVTIPSSNGAVTCAAWSVNASWAIPSDATPGWYWVLMKNAGGTVFGGMLFCVSDANAKKSIVVVSSDGTWHAAYNGYGGNNVYGASTGIGTIADRALCSTYDKPVISRDNVSQTHFFNGELAQLRFYERMGIDVAYTTCEQVNNDPTILDGRSLIIFNGHNEYISTRIRDKVEAIIGAGTNVANFAANDFFWRVAYGGTTFPTGATDTSTGRVMWCKKDTMAGPSTHTAGTAFTNAADWTGTWQDTRWANRKPSRDLLGDDFIANGIRADAVKVPVAMKGLPIWRNCSGVQALTTGQTFSFGSGTAGMEWDYPDPTGTLPSVSLSASVVDLEDNSSDANGENYNQDGVYTHAFQMLRNGSAHIFNANTTQWGWALDDLHLRNAGNVATAEARQATLNVLYDLGAAGNTTMIGTASLTVPTPVSNIDTDYGLATTTTGSMNATLPKVTASVPGAVITTATLNATTPKTTASIPGTVVTIGTLDATLPKVTVSIPGESLLPVTGAIAANLPRVTASLTGAITTTGTITATLPKIRAHVDDGVIRNITVLSASIPPGPTATTRRRWSSP